MKSTTKGLRRGQPLVFLHGGPDGGIEPFYQRSFDPKKWRIRSALIEETERFARL